MVCASRELFFRVSFFVCVVLFFVVVVVYCFVVLMFRALVIQRCIIRHSLGLNGKMLEEIEKHS